VITVSSIAAGVTILSVSVWWWYITTRRKREGYERVAQEEEERANEREQEQANRQWRRLSRSEQQRPVLNFGTNAGNGNGGGNGTHPVEDD